MLKKHRPLLFMIILVIALTSFADAAEVTHVIRDEFGFESPQDAMEITLPTGWDVKGGVQWSGRPSCLMEPMKMHFMATAPDGKQWVEFIPGGVWGWSSSLDAMPHMAGQGLAGCDARRILNIETFVNEYVPSIRPNAKVISMKRRPDQAQEALMALGNLNLQAGQRPRMEVMETRIRYEANGHTVNELLMPAVLFVDQPAMDAYGGMSGYTTIALAVGTLTSASVGKPAEESLLKFVGDSMQNKPDYLSRLASRYQQRSQMMAEAGRRRHAAQQAWLASRRAAAKSQSNWKVDKSGSDILDIQMDTYNNKAASQDRTQARIVDATLERKPWLNSNGQTVYMPQQYQRAYQLPNGVYAGTNDRFFNPVQTFGDFADPMREGEY